MSLENQKPYIFNLETSFNNVDAIFPLSILQLFGFPQ